MILKLVLVMRLAAIQLKKLECYKTLHRASILGQVADHCEHINDEEFLD